MWYPLDDNLYLPLSGKKMPSESVAERDFLRTEGDPAAVGYTINEAVALTRSMVCFFLYTLHFEFYLSIYLGIDFPVEYE